MRRRVQVSSRTFFTKRHYIFGHCNANYCRTHRQEQGSGDEHDSCKEQGSSAENGSCKEQGSGDEHGSVKSKVL